MNLSPSEQKKINRSIIACILATSLIGQFNTPIGIAIGFGFVLFTLKSLIIKNIKKTNSYMDNVFTQLENYQNLLLEIQPNSSLPNTRGWAGSPDFLMHICKLIKTEKPNIILEASSGASTIVSGYCIKKTGGHVISLEHELEYAEQTISSIKTHNLEGVCEVIHAPLIPYDINGNSHKWYDLSSDKIPAKIDMLIIDGPPTTIQNLARFPALPLLIQRLKAGGLIILDDAKRDDEKTIISKWLDTYPEVKIFKRLYAEKGICVLQKK